MADMSNPTLAWLSCFKVGLIGQPILTPFQKAITQVYKGDNINWDCWIFIENFGHVLIYEQNITNMLRDQSLGFQVDGITNKNK